MWRNKLAFCVLVYSSSIEQSLELLANAEKRMHGHALLERGSRMDPSSSISYQRNIIRFNRYRAKPVADVFYMLDHAQRHEQGHYDGVIHNYREMHLSSWPPDTEFPGLSAALQRIRSLYPSGDTQTHLLHLSSEGEILPHIDNISASGTWILGVSLGAERVMRLEHIQSGAPPIDIVLPSGSVYIQKWVITFLFELRATIDVSPRDSIRYDYKHSVLKGGQRLSIMVRVRFVGHVIRIKRTTLKCFRIVRSPPPPFLG